MTVLITLTTAGIDAGPFDLYSNVDGYTTAFETGVSKSALVAGYTSNLVPNSTITVRVKSTGVCTNFIDIPIGGITTTTSSTSTTTTTVAPAQYKVRSFSSGQNIQNTPCLGDEQWNTAEFYITIQLVENDGITAKINNTGGNIVIRLYYEETGCYSGYYIRDAVILPGQSQVVVENKTGVAACPECINTAETIQCYIDITPSYVEPTQEFLSYISTCPIFDCTEYTVSTSSGTGQSYTYTTCEGNQSGGTLGGAGGFDADTFCARTGTVNLIGSELSISSNGSCNI